VSARVLPPTIAWQGDVDGQLVVLDQTRLPHEVVTLGLDTLADVVDAITRLAVRGAPAIGVAAGYGMVLGVRARAPQHGQALLAASDAVGTALIAARPTAVNLAWAVRRVQAHAQREPTLGSLLTEARAIHAQDVALCRAIGEFGAPLLEDGMTVLTHCNTGRLATTGDGTALAVLYAAQRAGRRFHVLADETRPLLQGARLTAFELGAAGIDVEVIADSAAASLLAKGQVQLVLAGADRIARNGDVANKIGTYGLALAAHAHRVPMWIAAPASTFDLTVKNGAGIPIEERAADEVLSLAGVRVAGDGVRARNPAFDVTAAHLLTGLITDRGLIRPITEHSIKALLG
jgi:methylthioribose-1-phosphate isomerase